MSKSTALGHGVQLNRRLRMHHPCLVCRLCPKLNVLQRLMVVFPLWIWSSHETAAQLSHVDDADSLSITPLAVSRARPKPSWTIRSLLSTTEWAAGTGRPATRRSYCTNWATTALVTRAQARLLSDWRRLTGTDWRSTAFMWERHWARTGLHMIRVEDCHRATQGPQYDDLADG